MAKGFPNVGATVIDTSADLPTASAALEGVMMFQKDSNELKICDGSSWVSVIDTDTPSGLNIITPTSVAGTGVSLSGAQVTFSSATTVSVNGCFNAAFNSYRIIIDSSTNTGGGQLRFKTRSGGSDSGGGYTTTGVDTYVSGGTGYTSPLGTGYQGIGYAVCGLLAAAAARSLTTIDIYTPGTSTGYTIGNFLSSGASNTTGLENYVGSFINYGGPTVDGFSVYTTGTNWTGTLRVYGNRNA